MSSASPAERVRYASPENAPAGRARKPDLKRTESSLRISDKSVRRQKVSSERRLVLRSAATGLRHSANTIRSVCRGPSPKSAPARNANTAQAGSIIQATSIAAERFCEVHAPTRTTADRISGNRGGYFVSYGSSGKLLIRYPCP